MVSVLSALFCLATLQPLILPTFRSGTGRVKVPRNHFNGFYKHPHKGRQLLWKTLDREPMLDKRAAAKASTFLSEYWLEKGIYMKINYFNADHTHARPCLKSN